MKKLYGALACAFMISACATPGAGDTAKTANSAEAGITGDRTQLTREELGTMRPQIAEHLTCMASKASVYAGGASDLGVLVDTAAYTCRPKLGPLSERLKHFNLTAKAQLSYVRAIEMASRSIIADRLLKARTRAESSQDMPAGS
jgi:hypothetical protein